MEQADHEMETETAEERLLQEFEIVQDVKKQLEEGWKKLQLVKTQTE